MEEYLQYLIEGYGHKDYDNFIFKLIKFSLIKN